MRTSPRTAATAWPGKPPELRKLAMPVRLIFPLPVQLHIKPIGTLVQSGDALCATPSSTSHTPLTPCDARIVKRSVQEELQIIEMETASSHAEIELEQDLPREALDALSTIDPGDLGVWTERLLAHGVHADRPGCPDLAGQLHGALLRPVDTILCRVLQDDPAIPLGSAVGALYPNALVMGAGVLGRLTRAKRIIVALDASAPASWSAELRSSASKARAQVVCLPNHYPQADPTLLMYTLLGRKVRPERAPGEAGVMLIDAPAAVAIGQAWAGRKMLQVPCSLHDPRAGRAHLFAAPVGATVGDLLEAVGLNAVPMTVRMGHPLRDRRTSLEASLGTSDLSFHVAMSDPARNPAPCLRCAWCIEGCPVHIHPAGLLDAAQQHDAALADHHGIGACIECGICTYVCPSELPLLAGIRTLRN